MGVYEPARLPLWQDVPPSHQPAYIPVIWPKNEAPVRGYILCARPEGCWTHPLLEGNKVRTMPCVGRENGCAICSAATRIRWQGYVPIFEPIRGRMYIAQVTKEAARRCPPLTNPKEILRGRMLLLTRPGRNANGLVVAEVHSNVPPTDLPPCPDVREALLRLWGLLPKMQLFEKTEVAHA